ncbi:MAG TPA: hypothetical protein VFD59_00300 [Nocardioidaceae bacterium]|nr:hypothetical protein [Nocardioidaceae bacterium]
MSGSPHLLRSRRAQTLDSALARATHGSDALVVLRVGERAAGMGVLVARDSAIMSHWRSMLRVMVHPDFQGQRGGDR